MLCNCVIAQTADRQYASILIFQKLKYLITGSPHVRGVVLVLGRISILNIAYREYYMVARKYEIYFEY